MTMKQLIKIAGRTSQEEITLILRWMGFKISKREKTAVLWSGATNMDHEPLCGSIYVKIDLTKHWTLRAIWNQVKKQIYDYNSELNRDDLQKQHNVMVLHSRIGAFCALRESGVERLDVKMKSLTPITSDVLQSYIAYCEEQRDLARQVLDQHEGRR